MTAFPRRVLYVENNEDGTVGGSHRCLVDIVRHLDRSRYEPVVVFYQSNRSARWLSEEGVEVHLWDRFRPSEKGPGWHRTSAAILRRVRFLKSQQIHLVHLNNSPASGFGDWLPAAKLLRIPCIAHARGGAEPHTGVRRWLLGRYDRVIAISDHMAQTWRDLGVPTARVQRLYDAIDIAALRARVRRSREAVRAELGLSDGAVVGAMVAHLRAWKGQHVMLSALAAMAPEARARFHVLFVGGAPTDDRGYAAGLPGLAKSLGVQDHSTFLGERDDVPDLVNASDLCVHAATIPEPFGLVVLEAMALGKLMIASRHGGPGEILGPGTGVTHDPASPRELARILSRVVLDPRLRSDLQAAAPRHVAAFRIERQVAEIQSVYAALILPRAP